MKYLVLEVRHGLANRMIAVASGLQLAELYNRRFLLVWPKEEDCPCSFEELFKPNFLCFATVSECLDTLGAEPRIDLHEHRVNDLSDCLKGLDLSSVPSQVLILRSPFFVYDHIDRLTRRRFSHLNVDCLSGFFADEKINRAFKAILRQLRGPLRPYLQRLTPHAEILEVVEGYASQHFRGRVQGIHLRGTDRPLCKGLEGLFFEKIRRLLSRRDRTVVFISGDDRDVIERARAIDPTRVLTYAQNKNTSQFRQSTMVDALADILLLARTDHIYKPPFSSFTLVSAAIGETPLTILYTHWPSRLIREIKTRGRAKRRSQY